MRLNRHRSCRRLFLLLAGFCALHAGPTPAQTVLINEFMAVNDTYLADEDGTYSDWLELRNTSTAAVNLNGWYLTDSNGNLRKWRLPAVQLAPGECTLIFCSNANRTNLTGQLHTNFKLDGGGEYLALVRPDGVTVEHAFSPQYPPQFSDRAYGYLVDGTNVAQLVTAGAASRIRVPRDAADGTNWISLAYDDSGWIAGQTGVGYDLGSGYSDLIATDVEGVMHGSNATCYLRIPFVVADPSAADSVALEMRYDDGFSAFLNGRAIASANAPVTPSWNASATDTHPDSRATAHERFWTPLPAGVLHAGTNLLAVQGLNRELGGPDADFLVLPELYGTRTMPGFSFLPSPSPGAPNQDALSPVDFSLTSRTFTNTLTVALSSPDAGSVIRYTLDRTVPTTNSAVYGEPLAFTTTRMLRARAFRAGSPPGPVRTETYYKLAASAAAFSSDLPVVVMESFGTGIPGKCSFSVFEPSGGRTRLTSDPVLTSRAKFEQRGKSTAFQPKYNMNVEAIGDNDEETAMAPLGLPADSDWVMYAPYWWEPTFMHNAFVYELSNRAGLYAPRTRFCEVFFNTSGGELSYPGSYFGVYVLMESIQRSDQRIDIAKLTASDTTEPVISGGYMMVRDDDEGATISTPRGFLFAVKYPRPDNFTLTHKTWLNTYCLNLEAALYGANYTDPQLGYRPYVEVDTWVLYALGQTFTLNADRNSRYFYKDREKGIAYGPLWDFDRTMNGPMGSAAYDIWDSSGIMSSYPWWGRMFSDANFWQEFVDTLGVLGENAWSRSNVVAIVDRMIPQLQEAQVRNFQRWPPSPTYRFLGWEAEVDIFRTWIGNRINWMLNQVVDPPALQPAAGLVPAGQVVTLSGPPGFAIYYTLDGTDPRASGGQPAPGATLYTGPIVLSGTAQVTARCWDGLPSNAGGHIAWSRKAAGLYVTGPVPVVISEVMYHPRLPSAPEAAMGFNSADFEFIELRNDGTNACSLLGVALSDGVSFTFTGSAVPSLDPGAYVLVVGNRAAFTNRYPLVSEALIAGEFTGSLNDGGERVELALPTAPADRIAFRYGDGRGWPEAADGAGHSLVPRVYTNQAAALDYGGHWRASRHIDGSPGAPDDAGPAPAVVVNEFMAHTDYTNPEKPEYDSNDWIELYNASAEDVPLADWYLSDDSVNLRKWRIPTATVIPAGGWLVFDEVTGFHSPITNGFGLHKNGERIFLSYLPGPTVGQVVDAVTFRGQPNGISQGRYRDGAPDWFALAPTPGGANALPLPRVRISELMYHPAPTPAHGEDNVNDEYIEIENPTGDPVSFWNADGTWRIEGGVDYPFPAGVTLAAGERILVVSFNPQTDEAARQAFLAAYSLTNGQARLFGPWTGRLSNRGDRVTLEYPQSGDLTGEPVGWVTVDEVIYFDEAPWPVEPDGTGVALQRRNGVNAGNAPASWSGIGGSPGGGAVRISLTEPADYSTLCMPGNIRLSAVLDSAFVSGAVHRVEFFDGPALVATDNTAPYVAVVALGAPARTLRFSARVTDDEGAWTSPVVRVSGVEPITDWAGDVTDWSATLAGRLDGGTSLPLRIYWGTSDGGAVRGAWAHVEDLGLRTPGSVSRFVENLDPGRTYFYRLYGTNVWGEGWATNSASFRTVGLDSWGGRATGRAAGYTRASTLTNFPVLITLGTNVPGFRYSLLTAPGGADLRFADETLSRSLPYEVDTWNTNGESSVWVALPTLSGTNTAVAVLWGNPAAVKPSYVTNAVVWATHQAVWHLAPDLRNALGGPSAVSSGTVTAAGIVGAGRLFDGAARTTIDPLIPEQWYGGTIRSLTLTLWVKPSSIAPGSPFGARDLAGTRNLYVSGNLRWSLSAGNRSVTGETILSGAWQQVAVVLDQGTARITRNDGNALAVSGVTDFTPVLRPLLGNPNGATNFFTGVMDEVRLAPVARSADWIWASYRTVAQRGSFVRFTATTNAPPPPPPNPDADGDGMMDAWERAYFGSTSNVLGSAGLDPDRDGASNWAEYVGGTNPTNGANAFELRLQTASGVRSVRFVALATDPALYTNKLRYYAVDGTPSLFSGWALLPGLTNIPGQGQTVVLTLPASNAPLLFYRGRVWLKP